jgi:predicted enzyme related to lactoylglutathione lyase
VTVARNDPLLRKIDAITIPVPDLDAGLAFYGGVLGHPLRWRNDAVGQAALGLPGGDVEVVLTTRQAYEPNWLVSSVEEAAAVFVQWGGRVVAGPEDIPVGKLGVVEDPFGNLLVLLDLSKGRYVTDAAGQVTGVVLDEEHGQGE